METTVNAETPAIEQNPVLKPHKASLDNIPEIMHEEVRSKLQLTGLDWDVRKENLVSELKHLPTPLAGVYREDNDAFLGAPSKKYTPYQNSELVATISSAARQFNLEIVSGGILLEGSRVYLQLELPDKLIGKSQVKRFITAVNHHNGLGSLGFGSTNDIFSQSTNDQSSYKFFRMYGNMDKFRHCSQMPERVRIAVNQLFQTFKEDTKTLEMFELMASTKLSDELLSTIMMKCYNIDFDKPQAEITPREQTKIERIATTVAKETQAQENTVWGMFNGILKLTQETMPSSKNQTDFLMAGSGYTVNMKAYSIIEQSLNKSK